MDAAKKGTWIAGLVLLALLIGVGLFVGPDRIREWFRSLYDVRGLVQWGGYTALAIIVFAETGLLVGFFLPGDSLLVMAGIFAAPTSDGTPPLLEMWVLFALLIPLAILGDAVNYALGRRTGPAIFRREDGFFFKKAHLVRAQKFYERHGGKTVVLARFLPIVRTFAPFAAGMAGMPYRRFALYNVVGAVAWVVSMVLIGYWLARAIPDLDRHIHLVIAAVIVLSFIPAVIELLRERRRLRRESAAALAASPGPREGDPVP
jgi:membrane-associated protein